MTEDQIHALKFPVGEFQKPISNEAVDFENCIAVISSFPKDMAEAVSELSEEQLNWVYRPAGWTIKQVVHHCSDSHMNAFIRLKLSLTEDGPTIRPYEEALWAELIDSTQNDLSYSLSLLEALHVKWVFVLRNMESSDFNRFYRHPEKSEPVELWSYVAEYAWHCKHHLGHVKQAVLSQGRY